MSARIHGMSGTPTYQAWVDMMHRCYSRKNKNYDGYGARGISVCARWHSFSAFLEDLGIKPHERLSIERRDNNSGYRPENCYWATKTQQKRNSRIYKNNKTGVSGVQFHRKRNRYRARIGANGKQIELGEFSTIGEAVEARKKAETKYWGK